MTMRTLAGSCRCGATSYELSVVGNPPVYCCHCLDCQKWSGSAFAEQAAIPQSAIELSGQVVECEVVSRQGNTSIQRVCRVCHSRIYSTNPSRPGLALLRAGSLDIASSLEPELHIWTSRKQCWLALPKGVATYEQNPPIEVFKTFISRALASA